MVNVELVIERERQRTASTGCISDWMPADSRPENGSRRTDLGDWSVWFNLLVLGGLFLAVLWVKFS